MNNSLLRDNYLVITRKKLNRVYEITCLAPEIPGSLARVPETVADWCIELRGSIEVDTGLILFGTRDSLKSAMAPVAVKYKCL